VVNFDQTPLPAIRYESAVVGLDGDVSCLHLPSAERRPNKNWQRRTETTAIGSVSLPLRKRGFFSLIN